MWIDTGVFLFAGTYGDTLDRLRTHYANRAYLGPKVDREVRGFARDAPAVDAPEDEHARYQAATAAINALLLGPTALQVQRLTDHELPLIEPIKQQLAAMSNTNAKKSHGGEAELIVLASRAANDRPDRRNVLLTNDAAASVVAGRRHLPSRHGGDMLAELACSDASLDCDSCWARFQAGHAISGIPTNARQRGRDDFTCRRTEGECQDCAVTGD
ncbi:hypothetical protein QUV83_10175 [Cellulomonas cellasea]|uniref:hypothetical protein n=1 Tax=Cellulomonas cellasea TaxID=43670 RepID=UPI0025A4C9FD|nr:hypothetical protein [Cellulomonas cellasea]MDM8085131.1 hypothetical protein [Cellulomonas cellasea]